MRAGSRGTRSLLAVLLAACAACQGGGDALPLPTAAPGGPQVIVVASGRDVTGSNGVRQQLITAWNARHPDLEARLVELPGSADEQRSQLLGALQSGSARYDVVNLDVTSLPEFADADLIRPLDDRLIDGDVIKSVAATARWDGKLYAVPFNTDVGLLFYRRDYLAAAGLRDGDVEGVRDWQRMDNLIDDLNEAKGHGLPVDYDKGWTSQLADAEGRTVNAVEAFASLPDPVPLTDDDGRYTASVRDLERGIGELRGRTLGPYLLGDAWKSHEAESLTAFADGRTAFLRHWPYAYGTLHQSLSSGQLGVTRLPGKAVLGGQNLAVTRSSANEAGAVALIRYLTSAASERCLLDAGFAATRTSAYQDDDVTCRSATSAETTSPTPAGSPGSSGSSPGETADRTPRDASGRPAYARSTLLPALVHAVSRPRTPLYGAFTQTFSAEIGRLQENEPPSDEELAERLDRALRHVLPDG
ncbi:extracellular solute-binding protein [Streptomyces sp. NPDC058459]|uniref:extracellular solute-binding protein n=1 Tax=Streptomyces sp. NPDC058459 TaxID=3346508 RepID=UPI003648429A